MNKIVAVLFAVVISEPCLSSAINMELGDSE
jgi:hypothetical protein